MNRLLRIPLYLMRQAAESLHRAEWALFDRLFGVDIDPTLKQLDAGVERAEQALDQLRLHQRSMAGRRDPAGLRSRIDAHQAAFRLIALLATLRETRDRYRLLSLSLLLTPPRRPWWRSTAGPFA